MCMHWLQYVRLNWKDRLKNMRATTLVVVVLVDVREPTVRFRLFSNVCVCVCVCVELAAHRLCNGLQPNNPRFDSQFGRCKTDLHVLSKGQ